GHRLAATDRPRGIRRRPDDDLRSEPARARAYRHSTTAGEPGARLLARAAARARPIVVAGTYRLLAALWRSDWAAGVRAAASARRWPRKRARRARPAVDRPFDRAPRSEHRPATRRAARNR